MKRLFIPHFAVLLFSAVVVHAQVNLSTIPYSQNFDTLAATGTANTWADNTTLPGWYAALNTSGVASGFATYSTTSGSAGNSALLYSTGDGVTPAERSLGGIGSSTRQTLLGLRLANDTGSVFNNVQISYDLEQWNNGGATAITLSYQVFTAGTGSLGAGTWTTLSTTPGPLTTTSPVTNGLGNTTGLTPGITSTLTGLNLLPTNELWVRWSIAKVSGGNSATSIDNISVVTSVPEPSTAAFLGLGFLALLGSKRLRRAL